MLPRHYSNSSTCSTAQSPATATTERSEPARSNVSAALQRLMRCRFVVFSAANSIVASASHAFFWGGNKKKMCEILSDLVYLVYLVLGTTYEVFCQTLFEDDWRNNYRNLIVLDDKTVATWRCSLKSSPLEDVHKLRAHGDISPQRLHNLLRIRILLKNYSTRGDQVYEQLMRKQELL